jgi:drug/metabolite transporter (DMT)-like permease
VTTHDRQATTRATLIGVTAIPMWATLALLTSGLRAIPPLQLVTMAFLIAFAVGTALALVRGRGLLAPLRQSPAVWAVGIGGLFGWHLLYFIALRTAPPVEANLLNYLWPLLMVLFSALLPGERLHWFHAAGGVAGLAGTALLVTGGTRLAIQVEYLPGYLAGLGCGVTWAAYSVASRRFGNVPTEAVGGFCLATAALALPLHLLLETTVLPRGGEWLALAAMGLGPVGAAFFVWDHGVKHGDIRALAVLAYATPLMSTALLILSGRAELTWVTVGAATLIVGGAMLAGLDLLRRRSVG